MTTCGVTAQTQQPSFDCAKASTQVEHLICSNTQLADADVQLNQLYRKTLQQADNKIEVKQDQINWLKKVRNICGDAECISEAYSLRLGDLKEVDAKPSVLDDKKTAEPANTISTEEIGKSAQSPEAAENLDTNSSSVTLEPKEAANLVSSMPATEMTNATNQSSQNETKKEKPAVGSISNIATSVHALIVLAFVIGMFNPAWILRWEAKPTRKRLFLYSIFVGVLVSGLAELTKSPEAKIYEKMQAVEKAKQVETIAKQKEIPRSHNAVTAETTAPKPRQTRMQIATSRFASLNKQLSNSLMADDPRCQSALVEVLREIESTAQQAKQSRSQYAIDKVQSPHLADAELNQYNNFMDIQAMKTESLLNIASTTCGVY